ncbi:MAG: ABC transporter permease [Chloroflexi bacterium]|nr:ABC transporter permease [Chloroflexota bacterium]
MNPLSVFTYYLRNLVKLAPVFLVLALAVFGISLTGVLTGSISASAIEKVAVYKGAAMISPSSNYGRNTVDANIKGDLARNPNLVATFPTIRVSTYMPTLAGQTSAHIYAVNNEVFPVLLQTFRLKMVQGRLPRVGTNEVTLHKKFASARGFRVGDVIDPEQDDQEWLPTKLEIVGILDGPTTLSLASLEYFSASQAFKYYPRSVLAIPRAEVVAAAESDLQNLDKDLVHPYTYQAQLNEFLQEFAVMDTIVWSINSIVVLVLSLLAGLLNLIYFLDRMNEFGLLLGIGYSRSFVIRRALIESLALTFLAWVFGIFFSQVVYTLLNMLVFEPRGVSLSVLNWHALQFTLPIPVMVGLFSAGTVLWQLRKLDPMQMIERRD